MTSLMGMFKRDTKQEYSRSTKHLANVSYAISKFDTLRDSILNSYNDGDSNKDIKKSLAIAEKTDKEALANNIEGFLVSKDIDNIMKREIRSKEQGLDYAVAVGLLDDYVEYLRTQEIGRLVEYELCRENV